jgi:hypothetical protein
MSLNRDGQSGVGFSAVRYRVAMHERWTTRVTARAIALVSVTLLTVALLSGCSWRVTTGSAAISGTVTLPEGVDLGDNSVIDVSIHRPGEEETVAYTLAEPSGEFEIFDIPTGEYTADSTGRRNTLIMEVLRDGDEVLVCEDERGS